MNQQILDMVNNPLDNEPFVCALSGHRILPDDFDQKSLKDHLELLLQADCVKFLCGMATGFDLLALSKLAELKGKYRFSIEACIPFRGHERGFTPAFMNYYRELLSYCDKKTVLSEAYFAGCFLVRDRYMVDHSDALFAYQTKSEGGTAYTTDYAAKRGKKVFFMK